jgi:phage/plasmid-like protein (TIGR03299 family)
MAHYFDAGFCVRRPSWHGLENLLENPPANWTAARKAADLTWEPLVVPVYGFQGLDGKGQLVHKPGPGIVGDYFEIEDRQRTVRSDTGSNLGIMSTEWHVFDHKEFGKIVEAFQKVSKGKAKYETLLSLEGGKQVVATLWLDEPFTVGKDKSFNLPYIIIKTRHDGTAKTKAMGSIVRVVCANTSHMAEMDATGKGTIFEFSHDAKWPEQMQRALEAIAGVRQTVSVFRDLGMELGKLRISKEQRSLFVEQFIPIDVTAVEVSNATLNRKERAREQVMAILNSDTCADVAGTGQALWYAGIEYLDHYNGQDRARPSKQLTPQPVKTRLAELVREVAKA